MTTTSKDYTSICRSTSKCTLSTLLTTSACIAHFDMHNKFPWRNMYSEKFLIPSRRFSLETDLCNQNSVFMCMVVGVRIQDCESNYHENIIWMQMMLLSLVQLFLYIETIDDCLGSTMLVFFYDPVGRVKCVSCRVFPC